ncbi:MAG: glycosyltransferase [Parcubacteria group bacterium Gr01-1014_30]|nr:MAG: glycosyltransferase [Parcubacteria group bacterium Gr01-1014_30]
MLSVIIPTFNEEDYLPGLLTAIKKQEYEDYEVIVADAGSKDKTVEIAKSFGAKVVAGGLPAKGRNEGARAANGSLLMFLDADIVSLPERFFKDAVSEFKRRNAGVVSFPVFVAGKKIDKLAYLIYNVWAWISQKFLPHASNAILVRKEVHNRINGFDEEIKIAEDHDYARRAAKISKFAFFVTPPILTSARRLERDGRVRIYLKYCWAEILTTFFGPVKSRNFKYEFGHYKSK